VKNHLYPGKTSTSYNYIITGMWQSQSIVSHNTSYNCKLWYVWKRRDHPCQCWNVFLKSL